MRIAQIAPLIERVPPKGYGGTELVVSLLTEQLVLNGHDVTLFASGDSLTESKLISVIPEALRKRKDIPLHRWPAYELRSLLKLQEMSQCFDIVHNHMGYYALPFLQQFDCPVVTTNHNQVADYCADIFLAHKQLPFISISEAYRQLNYPNDLNYIRTIYNGIDIDRFVYDPNAKRDCLLFIGRVSEDKGTASAIDMAVKLGLPLKIAGKVDLVDETYFAEEVKPRLNNKNIEFLGEVNEDEKIALYKRAIAVLYPITFAEPFGLVMAEALCSGTPVIALDKGSVREVISDGETGIVATTVDELLDRFNEIGQISNAACHQRAADLFSKERMTSDYEKVYYDLQKRLSNRCTTSTTLRPSDSLRKNSITALPDDSY